MTDLTQMIRWNANFVRGLAESVLNRAKVIRTSLTPAVEAAATKTGRKTSVKKPSKTAVKKAAVKRATKGRRPTKRNQA